MVFLFSWVKLCLKTLKSGKHFNNIVLLEALSWMLSGRFLAFWCSKVPAPNWRSRDRPGSTISVPFWTGSQTIWKSTAGCSFVLSSFGKPKTARNRSDSRSSGEFLLLADVSPTSSSGYVILLIAQWVRHTAHCSAGTSYCSLYVMLLIVSCY